MSLEIRAICINDNNKPKEIHPERWISFDKQYHITHVYYHPNQGIQGVELKEVKLTEEDHPYESYRLDRFGILKEDIEKFKELMKLCTDLNDFDINKLIEQEIVEYL